MKLLRLTLAASLSAALSFGAPVNGKELFEAKCTACHITTPPNDPSTLVAPPAMGIMRHVTMTYPSKDEAVKFIVEYVQNPTLQKAVCMPQSIDRFGLMPSQKGAATPEEFKAIAEYLFDNFGFRGQGMGRGMGRGNGPMGR